MLSVTLADFDAIKIQYSDLDLKNYTDYIFYEVGGDGTTNDRTVATFDFSEAGFKDAIKATSSVKHEIIVVRTTHTPSTSTIYLSNEIIVNSSSASANGRTIIISLGDNLGDNLILDAQQQSRVFDIGSNANVALAGLTITNGLVTGDTVEGGGIRNAGTLTITNSTITENTVVATSTFTFVTPIPSCGGGIYNGSGILIISNSTVSKNTATASNSSPAGGGIYNHSGTLTITNSAILENTATTNVAVEWSTGGGGICNNSGTLTITNCTVIGNTVSSYSDFSSSFNTYSRALGGGIYNWGNLTITDSTISENSSISSTHGFSSINPSGVSLANGGGIFNVGTLAVTNSEIAGNIASASTSSDTRSFADGGGILNDGTLTVTNSVIAGNTATTTSSGTPFFAYGGGISNFRTLGAGTLTITNSTIAGNSARWGGGIYIDSGTLTINNTIVARNSATDGMDIYPTGTFSGSNNLIGVDPKFVSFTTYTTWNANLWKSWDLRLVAGSPAIDTGNNQSVPPGLIYDLAGNPRIINGTIDIGTYEFTPLPPVAPANFHSPVQTSNSVTLVWSAQQGLTSYRLEYKTETSETWLLWTAPGTNASSATITGLTANTQYNIRMTATNTSGNATSIANATTNPPVPPTTPTGLTIDDKTVNSVALSWDGVTDATSYEIQHSTDGETWTNVPVSGTTVIIDILIAGTAYQFQVLAVNADGKSEWSEIITVATLLSTPTGLTDIDKSTDSVTLEWNEVNGATGYEIQYSIGGETKTVTVSETSKIIAELDDNTAYEFRVRAVNTVSESDWSILSVTTDRIPAPPTTPDNLRDTDKSTNSVTLQWDAVDNATSYEIQHSTDGETWANVPVLGTSAIIDSLIAGTAYQFQVLAVNADGKSEWSEGISVTTAEDDIVTPTIPTAPVILSSTKTTDSILLTWNPITDATSYEIQWMKPGDLEFVLWTGAISGTTANFTELTADTLYQFQVRAVNAVGESEWSDTHFVTTAKEDYLPLAIPTDVKMDGRSTTTLTISWTGDDNAEGYTIQWSATEDFAAVIDTGYSNTAAYEISGLTAGAEYWVRITATTTAAGYQDSSSSAPVKFTTAEDTSTFAPSVTSDSDSVTIFWTEGTLPAGSKFQFKLSTSSEWITWITSAVPTSNMVITGLKADTAYEFRLMDASGEQIGEVIQKTTEQSTSDIPAANPVKPKASVVKKGDNKSTISSVTLTWDALPKKATADSNVVYIITCTSHPDITPIAVSGTDKLSHTFTGLQPGTTYKFTITAVNADGESANAKGKPVEVKITAKTPKYTVAKMKADTKGTIVTGGDSQGQTKTTIDSVTLTWATADRPEGEKLVVKIWDIKAKAYIDIASESLEWSTGTDKKGNELATLTIAGLEASTKYRVEVQAYTGESLEEAIYKTEKVAKVSISTAKFAAVSKVKATPGSDSITLDWQLPGKPADGAVYVAYEIDWVVSKTERRSVAIDLVAADGKSATVLLDTLANLDIDLTSTKKHNFVIRAVIKDGVGNVVNQSLETKFSVTPSKLV